jgi:hypothetical protein
MKLKGEPALLYGFAAAIFAVLAAYGIIGEGKIRVWEALIFAAISLAQAILTRSDSMAMNTIHKAGLTATEIHARADDPSIEPVQEDDPAYPT